MENEDFTGEDREAPRGADREQHIWGRDDESQRDGYWKIYIRSHRSLYRDGAHLKKGYV